MVRGSRFLLCALLPSRVSSFETAQVEAPPAIPMIHDSTSKKKAGFLCRSAPRKDVADDSQLTSAFPRITYPHASEARSSFSLPFYGEGGWPKASRVGLLAHT